MAARCESLIPMIERKMEMEMEIEIEKVSAHDNNSKYIVFNMSLDANVNTSELSNGHNLTYVVYPIYICFSGKDMTNMTTVFFIFYFLKEIYSSMRY